MRNLLCVKLLVRNRGKDCKGEQKGIFRGSPNLTLHGGKS